MPYNQGRRQKIFQADAHAYVLFLEKNYKNLEALEVPHLNPHVIIYRYC